MKENPFLLPKEYMIKTRAGLLADSRGREEGKKARQGCRERKREGLKHTR